MNIPPYDYPDAFSTAQDQTILGQSIIPDRHKEVAGKMMLLPGTPAERRNDGLRHEVPMPVMPGTTDQRILHNGSVWYLALFGLFELLTGPVAFQLTDEIRPNA